MRKTLQQRTSLVFSAPPVTTWRRSHLVVPRLPMHKTARAQNNYWQAIETLHDAVDSKAAYLFTGETAALIQGVTSIADGQQLEPVQITVQWDFFHELRQQLTEQQLSPGSDVQHAGGIQQFQVTVQGMPAVVSCELNAVAAMNPNRACTEHRGRQLWCESLLSALTRSRSSSDGSQPSQLAAQVSARLQQLQAELTAANAEAWSQAEAGDAWLNKLGRPREAAARLLQDPLLRLGRPLAQHLPRQLTGCRLINLMCSHGSKAVAAALLGATVTCVDISPENLDYGRRLADAAGVADRVTFVRADVLHLPPNQLTGGYDVVLLELGVLHYFVDLQPLMDVVVQLLRPGGRFVLREFHPVSTKLITSKGKKRKVAGNYFAQELCATEVAYSKYTSTADEGHGSRKGVVVLRQWGLGEVVTAAAAAGLVVQQLQEEPGVKLADFGVPKLFTLVAARL